jgi:hypothetical protein
MSKSWGKSAGSWKENNSNEGLFNHVVVGTNAESKSMRIREGFIKGQHAYEAGNSQEALPSDLTNLDEEEGFRMGWMARYIAEKCGLAPSVIGSFNYHGVDDDWNGERYRG